MLGEFWEKDRNCNFANEYSKGTFLSESTDVFFITPNKRTFFFPETEILNFGEFLRLT